MSALASLWPVSIFDSVGVPQGYASRLSWRIVAFVLVLPFLMSTGCAAADDVEPPTIIDGTLDLSAWDFERHGPVSLAGEWLFAWQSMVEPAPWEAIRATMMARASVPGAWRRIAHPDEPGEMLPRQGHATYALRVRLPPGQREIVAKFGAMQAAARLGAHRLDDDGVNSNYVDNGKPSALADEEETGNGCMRPQLPLRLDATRDDVSTVLLTIELSNHNTPFVSGGIYSSPQLHDAQTLAGATLRRTLVDAVVLGVCLIIGLYHLIAFGYRRQDQAALYFACLCLSVAIVQLSSLMGSVWPELGIGRSVDGWLWTIRFQTLAMPLAAASCCHFLQALAPTGWYGRFTRWWTLILGGVLVAYSLLAPAQFFVRSYSLFHVQILVALAVTLVHLSMQALRGEQLARWLLSAFGFLTVGTVNDVLLTKGMIQSVELSSYGFIAFILMQASLLAKRLAESERQAAHLSGHLQEEVRSQTVELRAKTDEAMRAKRDAEALRERALEDAEKLRELDQQKTVFFQNMSHELRTPLTLILGPLEKAVERDVDNEDIAVASKNARRLLRLVNQLLDFQKLEAGRKEFELEPVNINRFTYVLGDYFASACSSKDIDFHVTRNGHPLDPEDVVAIMGESDAIEKVAFNFLSNALKYTPRGGRIELGLWVNDERQARLYVRDSGPGISEDGQAKLFEVFSQVEGGTTREYEGTGLGLALAKSLVEKMGGVVGVESELGCGSTFFASFPVLDAGIELLEQQEEFKARSWMLADGGETGVEADLDERESDDVDVALEGRGRQVLIVDDLEDMRNLVGSALESRGYRVLRAVNGAQGYDKICERKPDLVISDWMMPKLSGPGMLEKVRANPDVAGTPVVLLTAKSDAESKMIGTEVGADSFLGKPFNDQELASTVRNLLGLKAREKEVEELNEYITESVLKRYLPPPLISDILSGKLHMDKPAELRDITILFSDLKGFTSISEKLGPEGISRVLNEYLSEMNKVIFEHGGTIDKFIGDAIMVLFGAPQDMSPSEQAAQATECAKAMQVTMGSFTKNWEDDGASHLKMRIGIHHGQAVVGNFGSTQRSDYTAIGPAVNFASRIESASSAGEVFVSEAVAGLLDTHVTEAVGAFDLKGIDGAQTLYRVG